MCGLMMGKQNHLQVLLWLLPILSPQNLMNLLVFSQMYQLLHFPFTNLAVLTLPFLKNTIHYSQPADSHCPLLPPPPK